MEFIRDCICCENHLLPDEEIVWKSRPGTFPLITKESGLLMRWIICAVLLVGLTAAYIAAAQRTSAPFHVFVVLIIFVALAYIAIVPILDWKSLLNKTHYYVTNKRVILLSGKNLYALCRTGLNMKCVEADGGVHILFGSGVTRPAHSWRRYTVAPDPQSDPGFVFYGVSVGKDRLKEILSL